MPKQQLTRSDVRSRIEYKIPEGIITQLQHGRENRGRFYPPLLIEGVDWFTSKLGNTFYYNSSVKKLKKYIQDKEKKLFIKNQ